MAQSFDVEGALRKLTIGQKVRMLAGLGWWHTQPVPEAGVPSVRFSDGPNGVRGTRFFNGVPSSCFPSSTGLGSSFDIDLARQVGEALADECRAKSTHVLLGPTVNTQRSPLGGRSFESFSEDPHLNGTLAAAYINGLQSKGVAATIKHFVANDQEFQRFSISSEVSERALREIYLKPFQIAIKNSDPWAVMSAYNRVNGLHVSENPWLLDDILRKEWGFKGMIMSDWIGTYSTTEAIKAGLDLEMPGPAVMRGKAVERALVAEKLLPGDIDERVRKILGLVERATASGIPFDGPENGVDTPELRALLRRAAADATVLLKNDKSILPLDTSSLTKIAVIGPNAKQAFTSGGGSARLLETYNVNPLEGIRAAVKNATVEVAYTVGATTHKYLPLLDGYLKHGGEDGALVEFWNEEPVAGWEGNLKDGAPAVWSTPTRGSNCAFMDGIPDDKVNLECWLRYTTEFTPDESGDYDFGVTVTGRGSFFVNGERAINFPSPPDGEPLFGPGTADLHAVVKGLEAGKPVAIEVHLSNAPFLARGLPFPFRGGLRLGAVRVVETDEAIADAVKIAQEADVAILVVGLNHELESEGFDRADLSLPGATNKLVSAVLKANPKTVVVNQSGAPVEMPWIDDAHTVVQAFFGGNELGNGLADVLFGKVNPSGKLSLTFPKRNEDSPAYPAYGDQGESFGKILYNEGIYVGYRSYDKKSVEPLFPFGHGLSYTTFTYSDLSTTPISADGTFSVSFTVTNSGNVSGREVAQVYIADPASALPRPVKELKGFTKVALAAGESKTVTLALDREALGFFDERRKAWVAEAGKFDVLVGASSRDVRLTGTTELKETFSWVGL
ncbi:glycoside hydrolase family 3 protein [Auriscalpium vulgare]|uniref:Glycoside hydrolase family 3 protein n=1 Tax=Auriscalpium vulgare TaxID=40419 RepID=A0ACB8RWS3_9AGAM|nr:glycoside hydrolase family 3 protein [Auriscalpium vulgare]